MRFDVRWLMALAMAVFGGGVVTMACMLAVRGDIITAALFFGLTGYNVEWMRRVFLDGSGP